MKTASITEAKNNLSALIDGLRGGPVLILDRGRPVARLEAAGLSDVSGRMADQVRRGLATPPKGRLPPEFFRQPLPRAPAGASVVDALLRERQENR